MSTKRSHILKQTCSWKLQVCSSMCDLLVDIRHWRVKRLWFIQPIKTIKLSISNYRSISILPNLFKIHERLLYDQLCIYFSNFFPKYQCGFRSGYSAHLCLLALTEKMKEARDNNQGCAAVLTDLSKAFDCLLHDLLIAKLHAFGFDLKSLKVIHAYLNDRIQVTKVGSFYSEILQIIYGVPQGSILRPLLFTC